MTLTTMQFDILTYIERYQDKFLDMQTISDKTHYSVEDVEATLKQLVSEGLLDEKQQVTTKAYTLLESYKVKKAIFMAAGFGSRMVPLTLSMPKPLIKVNGKRIIETLLDAVLAAGIEDISIVRGYQAEAFDMLLSKYPMIKFIENPTYNEANNIGSALKFKDLMTNAYVLESDLVLYNPELIRKYELHTNYIGKYVNYTNDWCFDVEDEIIRRVNSAGGENCYHMYGISYWDEKAAQQMVTDIPSVFEMEGGHQRYFDEVALTYCKDNFEVYIRPVYEGDIIEIDTFGELQDIDDSYKI